MEANKPISHVVAGLIIGGILVLLSALRLFMFDNDPTKLSGWIDWILVIGALIMFTSMYAKAMDNNVTYGNLFVYGFKATLVFTIVILLFIVIMNVVDPGLKEKGLELMREKSLENKNAREEDVDKMMEIMDNYYWPITIGTALLGNILMGTIGSLIAAAIPKKNPRPVQQLDRLDS